MTTPTKILTPEQIDELVADANMHSVVCLEDFARAIEQAEAYAAAVRREALEEVVSLLESRFFKDQMQIERAIRALIQQEQS